MRSKQRINQCISARKPFSAFQKEAISCASETGKVYQVNTPFHNIQIDNCWQESFRIRDPKLLNKEEMAIYQKNHTHTHIQ